MCDDIIYSRSQLGTAFIISPPMMTGRWERKCRYGDADRSARLRYHVRTWTVHWVIAFSPFMWWAIQRRHAQHIVRNSRQCQLRKANCFIDNGRCARPWLHNRPNLRLYRKLCTLVYTVYFFCTSLSGSKNDYLVHRPCNRAIIQKRQNPVYRNTGMPVLACVTGLWSTRINKCCVNVYKINQSPNQST